MEPKEITSSCWMRMLTMLTLSRDKWYHDIWWCSKQHLRVWIWSVRVRCGSKSCLCCHRGQGQVQSHNRRPAQTALGVVFSCFLGMLEDWNTLRNGNAWVWNHTTATKWWYLMNLNESYRYNEFAQPNSAYHPQIPASFKSPIRLQVSSNWKRQSSELQGEHLRRCPGNPAGPQIQSDFVQKRGAV